MEVVIGRSKAITVINDEKSLAHANLTGKELVGLRKGLEANYRQAKDPIVIAGRDIDSLYAELDRPLEAEQKRLDRLVSSYLEGVRKAREYAQAQEEAKRRLAERQQQEKLNQLQREKEALEMKLRLAEEAREKAQLAKKLQSSEVNIEAAKVEMEIERESPIVELAEVPKPPGSREWIDYEVEITDPVLVYKDHPECVKWEKRAGACKALAKSLDERGLKLEIPGMTIKRVPRTSFGGATSIRVNE